MGTEEYTEPGYGASNRGVAIWGMFCLTAAENSHYMEQWLGYFLSPRTRHHFIAVIRPYLPFI